MLSGKKLLIFDLGGVLIDLHVERTFAAMQALGVPAEMLAERDCLVNRSMMLFDRGEITTDEMFGYIRSFVSAECSDEDMLRVWNLMLGRFSAEKLRRIKALRAAGYRVVVLSNTNEAHWPQVESFFVEAAGEPLERFFDALYLSFRMHRRKPQREIFLDLMAAEDVSPADCIFFDDSAENCDVARSMGIAAITLERNVQWGSDFLEI